MKRIAKELEMVTSGSENQGWEEVDKETTVFCLFCLSLGLSNHDYLTF